VAIGDKNFEVVKEFVCLGSLMTPTNDVSLEIQQRIQAANRCFFGLRKHLHSSHLSCQTKFTIHKTLIRSEPKMRRTNCSYLRGNAVYRRRYNHELVKEFNSPNVLNVTKTSRLRYTGHMIRRPEDLPQKTLFRAKPNGRINQGRPKSRWADGVNSDSLALVVRDCMHCAQDRQSWKDLLDQVLTRYWL
jgi:hypothetical protein